jgi:hypothetical protein
MSQTNGSCNRAPPHGSELNAVLAMGKVPLEIAIVLRRGSPEISMSPDRHGSGATRIEADLSIKVRRKNLMRRASTCLALLGLAVLGFCGVASAAPTVTLVAKAVPLAGYPGTGNILGAGAAIEAKYTISGTEFTGGVPSPLTHVNFFLPAGTKLHPQGFVTCSPSTLENVGPSGCPKKSQASPVGSAGVVDVIGGEPVRENATLQAFFAPGGGLQFYVNAAQPISAQLIASTGSFSGSSGLYSQEFSAAVKLIESVPGAPPVSTTSINIKVGSAFKQGNKTVYYGTLPKSCPKGGFPVKSEMTFLSGETVSVPYKAPCPKK